MIVPSSQIIKRSESLPPPSDIGKSGSQSSETLSRGAVRRRGLGWRVIPSQRPESDPSVLTERKQYFQPKRELLEKNRSESTEKPLHNFQTNNSTASSMLEKFRCLGTTNKYAFVSSIPKKVPSAKKPFSPVKVLISQEDANAIRKETIGFPDKLVQKSKINYTKNENHNRNFQTSKKSNQEADNDALLKVDKQMIEVRSGFTQMTRQRNRMNFQELCHMSSAKNVPDDNSPKMNEMFNVTNTFKNAALSNDKGSNGATLPNYIDLSALSPPIANDNRMSNDNSVDEVMEDNSNNNDFTLNNSYKFKNKNAVNESLIIGNDLQQSILSSIKSKSMPGGLISTASLESFKSPMRIKKNKEKIFLDIKNSSKEVSKNSNELLMSLDSKNDPLWPLNDVKTRRRKHLQEYELKRLGLNAPASWTVPNQIDSEVHSKLSRRRTIRGIYDVFFPSNNLRPTSKAQVKSVGGSLLEKLELRAKINEAKRRKALLADVFKDGFPESKTRKRRRNISSALDGRQESSLDKHSSEDMDIKGPLKYLFHWKTRLQQHVSE